MGRVRGWRGEEVRVSFERTLRPAAGIGAVTEMRFISAFPDATGRCCETTVRVDPCICCMLRAGQSGGAINFPSGKIGDCVQFYAYSPTFPFPSFRWTLQLAC